MRARVYAGGLAGAVSALGLWAWWPPLRNWYYVGQLEWLRYPSGPGLIQAIRMVRDGEAEAAPGSIALGLALGLSVGLAVWAGWGLVDCARRKG